MRPRRCRGASTAGAHIPGFPAREVAVKKETEQFHSLTSFLKRVRSRSIQGQKTCPEVQKSLPVLKPPAPKALVCSFRGDSQHQNRAKNTPVPPSCSASKGISNSLTSIKKCNPVSLRVFPCAEAATVHPLLPGDGRSLSLHREKPSPASSLETHLSPTRVGALMQVYKQATSHSKMLQMQ